jgi:hypothetical protein
VSQQDRDWFPGQERDENGVVYFEVYEDDPEQPSILIASRHPVDNYRLNRNGPPWVESATLVDYFDGNALPDRVRALTLDEARRIAEQFGGDLITPDALNPAGKPA